MVSVLGEEDVASPYKSIAEGRRTCFRLRDLSPVRLRRARRSGVSIYLSSLPSGPCARRSAPPRAYRNSANLLRAGWPWRLPARAPTDPDVRALMHPVRQP